MCTLPRRCTHATPERQWPFLLVGRIRSLCETVSLPSSRSRKAASDEHPRCLSGHLCRTRQEGHPPTSKLAQKQKKFCAHKHDYASKPHAHCSPSPLHMRRSRVRKTVKSCMKKIARSISIAELTSSSVNEHLPISSIFQRTVRKRENSSESGQLKTPSTRTKDPVETTRTVRSQ